MAELAVTACRRCREQKLRCSRELPKCARCLRLNAHCVFPPPPDRKSLAATRAKQKRRKLDEEANASASEERQPSEMVPVSRIVPSEQASIDTGLSEPVPYMLGQPSPSVQEVLQDVFFTCVFNATLIFHRPTFRRAFAEGSLPTHLLLAVCASATSYLVPGSATAKRYADELSSLDDLKTFGRQWAIQAGRRALRDIDQPSIEQVQTCQILTSYWFSQGETSRNTMFSGITYKAACTLGLDTNHPMLSIANAETRNTNLTTLEYERVRRCFWATWFTQSINGDHTVHGRSQNERVMNLPLPMSEEAYDHALEEPITTPSAVLNPDASRITSPSAQPSIMAELMTIMMFWGDTRDLLKQRTRLSNKEFLAELFSLEERLTGWAQRLPPTLTYSKRTLYHQLVILGQPAFTLLHALYNQCRLVAHSSLVPQFSGIQIEGFFPVEAVRLSARIALGSAQKLSELGAAIMALDWDPAQVAAFVGYTMYCSASIHLTFMSSHDSSLAIQARNDLTSSLRLLKSMKPFWANLQSLWLRVHVLYAAQQIKSTTSNVINETSKLDTQRSLDGIDEVVAQTRDAGQLAEPLADSVLDYTLKSLQPSAASDVRNMADLQHALSDGFLTQMIEEGRQFQPKQSNPVNTQAYLSTERGLPITGKPDPESIHVSPQPQATPFADTQQTWWDVDLDFIHQTMLPLEDLYGLENGFFCN